MAKKNKNQGESLFKAVILTHFIVFLHLLIIVGLVLMVIFFRSITQHLLWITLGATVLFILSAFFIYRRIKSKGRKVLHDIENSPLFRGRGVEVSFLGGMMSLKVGQPGDDLKTIENSPSAAKLQLESPEAVHIRELTELGRMYEKNLISSEEYNKAKNQIMKSL